QRKTNALAPRGSGRPETSSKSRDWHKTNALAPRGSRRPETRSPWAPYQETGTKPQT
ncbi:hypothetical protein Tco_0486076, partial [Tanacetum coccineum]